MDRGVGGMASSQRNSATGQNSKKQPKKKGRDRKAALSNTPEEPCPSCCYQGAFAAALQLAARNSRLVDGAGRRALGRLRCTDSRQSRPRLPRASRRRDCAPLPGCAGQHGAHAGRDQLWCAVSLATGRLVRHRTGRGRSRGSPRCRARRDIRQRPFREFRSGRVSPWYSWVSRSQHFTARSTTRFWTRGISQHA